MHRRALLVGSAVSGASLLVATGVSNADSRKQPARTPPTPGKRTPVALRFKPSSLTGISEKMITSHHGKNYVGAVKNLNKVETDLAALKADAAGYLVAGLREKELTLFNSMVLHEHYFGAGADIYDLSGADDEFADSRLRATLIQSPA